MVFSRLSHIYILDYGSWTGCSQSDFTFWYNRFSFQEPCPEPVINGWSTENCSSIRTVPHTRDRWCAGRSRTGFRRSGHRLNPVGRPIGSRSCSCCCLRKHRRRQPLPDSAGCCWSCSAQQTGGARIRTTRGTGVRGAAVTEWALSRRSAIRPLPIPSIWPTAHPTDCSARLGSCSCTGSTTSPVQANRTYITYTWAKMRKVS